MTLSATESKSPDAALRAESEATLDACCATFLARSVALLTVLEMTSQIPADAGTAPASAARSVKTEIAFRHERFLRAFIH